MTRRDFTKLCALGLLPSSLFAYDLDKFLGKVNGTAKIIEEKEEAQFGDERLLWLVRGNEEYKQVYFVNNRYSLDSYKKFCWLLRDMRDANNGFVAIDANIMNLLHKIQNTLASHGMYEPIRINSGYRSPKTNAATEGAAKNSYHVKGKAVDITLAGADASLLAVMGVMIQKGGVGFYPNKNFIHLDTGDVRTWSIGDDGTMRALKG